MRGLCRAAPRHRSVRRAPGRARIRKGLSFRPVADRPSFLAGAAAERRADEARAAPCSASRRAGARTEVTVAMKSPTGAPRPEFVLQTAPAGLLAHGVMRSEVTFPALLAPVANDLGLAANSCGGSSGFGRAQTPPHRIPFQSQLGTDPARLRPAHRIVNTLDARRQTALEISARPVQQARTRNFSNEPGHRARSGGK